MPPYLDLHSLTENQRIEMIGKSVMDAPRSSADQPLVAAFVVEDDVKADRYIAKLLKKFPSIRIIDRTPGPVVGMSVTVRVGAPLR